MARVHHGKGMCTLDHYDSLRDSRKDAWSAVKAYIRWLLQVEEPITKTELVISSHGCHIAALWRTMFFSIWLGGQCL